MEGEYPRFKSSYLQEELVAGFHLESDEFDFVCRHHGDANRPGIVILLKSLLHLGYFPETLQEVPESVSCSWVKTARAAVGSKRRLLGS
jgi:hypothetical protein